MNANQSTSEVKVWYIEYADKTYRGPFITEEEADDVRVKSSDGGMVVGWSEGKKIEDPPTAEQATLAQLTNNHRQIITALREQGDSTKRKLSEKLNLFPAMLDVLLPQLIGLGIVKAVESSGVQYYRFVTLTPVEIDDDIPTSNLVDVDTLSDAEIRGAILNNGKLLASRINYSLGEVDRAAKDRTGLVVYRRGGLLFGYFETR